MVDRNADVTFSELSRVIAHPRTVLDVGCGPRVGADVARKKGAKVTGIESSALAAAATRARFDHVIEADVEDDAAVRFLAGKTFDLILVGDALARTNDPRGLLRRFLPVLEDGGRVIVSVRGSGALRGRLAPMLGKRAMANGSIDRARVRELADDAGLEVLHVAEPLLAPPEAGEIHVVLRKPPARKKLSLTIGMISMNEAGAVGKVIDDIRQHVPRAEVLLVDSSKDDTPKIAESKGARVVRQFPPKGYGPAMHRLLYEATTDVIITMDCDGTYPADRLPELQRLVEDGADLVNATRTRHRPKAMPYPNFIANRVFAGAAHVLHGLPTTDVHSGMRAYRTSMLRGIEVDPKGPALPVELYVVPARLGYRIVELEIPYFERVGTTTLHRWDSTKWTFRRLLRARAGARVRAGRVENI